jgi:hypothetical protein
MGNRDMNSLNLINSSLDIVRGWRNFGGRGQAH